MEALNSTTALASQRAGGWRRQLVIFGAAYLAYGLGRWIAIGSEPVAVANAQWIARLEEAVSMDLERSVQIAFTETPWLWIANHLYLAAQFVVVPATLVWLYRRSRPHYRLLRDTVLLTWLISLPIYALFPVAPPRLAHVGLIDTISTQTGLALDSRLATTFYNPLAAVPSLHAGFAFAVSGAVYVAARSRTTRVAGLLWSVLVALAVVATGNHFVFDIAIGGVVTAAGFALALAGRQLRERAVRAPAAEALAGQEMGDRGPVVGHGAPASSMPRDRRHELRSACRDHRWDVRLPRASGGRPATRPERSATRTSRNSLARGRGPRGHRACAARDPPAADVGHVNLTVVDLQRSVSFYRDVLGLRITQQDGQSAFLAAGGYHHHVALNTWQGPVHAPGADSFGLHHFAIRLPDKQARAQTVVRLVRAGYPLLGATDHGVNLAVYSRDPDGNGLELMLDRPAEEWPRQADGGVAMRVDPLDLQALVLEALC